MNNKKDGTLSCIFSISLRNGDVIIKLWYLENASEFLEVIDILVLQSDDAPLSSA
jgi:hypothetical protein